VVPTDHDESDGTYRWQQTTVIVVEARSGDGSACQVAGGDGGHEPRNNPEPMKFTTSIRSKPDIAPDVIASKRQPAGGIEPSGVPGTLAGCRSRYQVST
jgi:hypothetical protein